MGRPKKVRQMVQLVCANEDCGRLFERDAVDVNYQRRFGKQHWYCSQTCSNSASGARMRRGYQLTVLDDAS